MTRNKARWGVSLLEVLIAFLLLLVSVLTMVGYTAMIHRSAKEAKRQAMASMEARAMLEQIRDHRPSFEQALTPEGLEDTRTEELLDTEADAEDNEVGRQSAANFRMVGRARLIAGETYSVVVTADWVEDGRPRQVVLESRMIRPGY